MADPASTTLVVIDDDPDVLRATARILQQAGYQVITGASAAEALALTRRHRPALLLLDVMLPDGNGVDVARQIKSEPALHAVFVILLSGLKTSGDDQAAGLTGGLADGYIARPIGKSELLARVDAMLRLRSAQEALREALARLQKIASRLPGMVYQYRLRPDGSSCFPYASDAIQEVYQVTAEQVRDDAGPVLAMVHPDDYASVIASIQTSARDLTAWCHDYRVKFADDRVRWLFGNALPEREADGGTLWHGFITDITERRLIEEQMRHQALYDMLTELPNRRLLNDRLRQSMAAGKRSGHYGALIFLDLDNFKTLNDTHGHSVGDLLLIEVTRRLKSCVRETDTVARFGGDEFVVLLSDLHADRASSKALAAQVAEKIRCSLAQPYVLNTNSQHQTKATIEHHCTTSIGVVIFDGQEASLDDILKWADGAMYQAKDAGRNRVQFYIPAPLQHLANAGLTLLPKKTA
ncbi:diguanylate cyclase [Rhodoferax sp.]|uniref:GGDEF domain-containing response regulator n=1 Tax=Rhodoferax sp. TaxID=50421 RepID=UPI0025ECDF89|nr:diguanylate cyclase [Rhodoferax sp.]